ncbi:MAG: NADH-quinone oxidoreductase subunit H [Ignisphaera sp.]|nr:NADH-quinone oxidoreductase subunit H [Ignisphaera sp.]MCX8167871.1 NADH-quinone oxidoreductase subunit H [Ignisphaera sp.]MDW8085488.1 complex I subunit 1 family protein [Ignisphaera sp.]
MDLLLLVVSALLFPGLVFLTSLALFSEWVYRKLTARMQNRMGPSYTGPMGVMQPFADLIKLLFAKEVKRQRYAAIGLAEIGLIISISSIVASLLLFPISPLRFAAPYDIIVLIYFYAVWHTIGIIIAVLAYPNPFTVTGLSRLIAITVVVEPAVFISLLIPVLLASNIGCAPQYSILCTAAWSWRLWLESPASFIAMALGLISVLIASQAKLGLKPFDIPEAEQELIAGHITEYSGTMLALYNLSHDIKLAFTALMVVYLFLGGPYPYRHLSTAGILLLIVKYLISLMILTVIRSSFGRLRIDQGLNIVAKYSLVPSIIGLMVSLIETFIL